MTDKPDARQILTGEGATRLTDALMSNADKGQFLLTATIEFYCVNPSLLHGRSALFLLTTLHITRIKEVPGLLATLGAFKKRPSSDDLIEQLPDPTLRHLIRQLSLAERQAVADDADSLIQAHEKHMSKPLTPILHPDNKSTRKSSRRKPR